MEELQKNIIIHGDCLEEMKRIPSNSIDLIFADPPYWMRVEGVLKRPEGTDFSGCDDEWDNTFNTNQDYTEFTRQWLTECYRILTKNGSIWVIGGMQCIYTIGAIMQELGFWFINDVIWHKTNPTPNFMGTRLNNSHETLIWATKDKKSKFTFHYKTAKQLNTDNISMNLFDSGKRKQMGSVWRFAVCNGNERLKNAHGEKLHSTQKPEELLYRIIALTSNMGDIVFDPFGGTMTTSAVAKKLGRNYLAIEQKLEYVQAGIKRVNQVVFEDNEIARAKFDEKPLKAPMVDMIKAGFFEIGERFYLKNSDEFAELTADGKLIYQTQIYDMHTLSAKIKRVKAERLNGFSWWQVERNKIKVSIDDIRENYRQSVR
ncbi:DNA-methyltransferase [Moraxella sp. ZJ142]|uniref:DNA-methyltransferase n=1 Tax=Moraxella marmotae TaxID=3344520 RepID=UPI0035D3E339